MTTGDEALPMGGDAWTPRRMHLRQWFRDNAPPLEGLYSAAVELLTNDGFPGRAYLIAHCGRELANRLPDYVTGPARSTRVQYKNELDAIADLWEQAGLPIDGSIPRVVGSAADTGVDGHVPLPVLVADRLSKLIRDHRAARQRPRDAALRLFAGSPEPSDDPALGPLVGQWIRIGRFFVGRAHAGTDAAKIPDVDDVIENFELFETMLAALFGRLSETMDEIDDLLAEANRRAD